MSKKLKAAKAATSFPSAALKQHLMQGGVAYTNTVLKFDMQPQVQTNWCWAATSTSVSLYYNQQSGWTQCTVACKELNRDDCCNNVNPNPCNEDGYLDQALQITGNFVDLIYSSMSFEDVEAQISAGKLVGVRIGWNGGGGHFLVIYGFATSGSTEYVYLDDPIYHKSLLPIDEFTNNYQGSGRWTHSYITKSEINMAQFAQVNQQVAHAIHKVRPLLQFDTEKAPPDSEYNLSLPHEMYNADLLSLKNENQLNVRKTGLRVAETTDKKIAMLYDINNQTEEGPVVHQIHQDEKFLKKYNSAIGEIADVSAQNDTRVVRVLRLPELYVEALWLHDEKKPGNDEFHVVRSGGFLDDKAQYSRADFVKALADAARRKDIKNDPLIGS